MDSIIKIIKNFVFFDLDGTIVDSAYAIAESWRAWAKQYSIKEPELEEALGGTSLDTIKKLIEPEKVQKAWESLTKYEISTAHFVKEIKGANNLLNNIPHSHWGLVTSSRYEVVLKRLENAGISPPRYLVTADDYIKGKPSPEPYKVALSLVNKCAEESVTFEDSVTGIKSARASDIEVIGVLTYSSKEELSTEIYIEDWTQVSIEPINSGSLSISIKRR